MFHINRILISVFLSFLCSACHLGRKGHPLGWPHEAMGEGQRIAIQKIIDGDSLLLVDEQQIRLVGINTQEWQEPLAQAALSVTKNLLIDQNVPIQFFPCTTQPMDKYQRQLGWVVAGTTDVQGTLLGKGLAVPMIIAPCGLVNAHEYYQQTLNPRKNRTGVWQNLYQEITAADQAEKLLGQYGGIQGQIKNIHQGKKAIHLNFGDDWRTDFTVTIFKKDLNNFKKSGIDPIKDYQNKTLVIFGYIMQYNGPQIIAYTPHQIEIAPPKEVLPITKVPNHSINNKETQ